MAAPRREKPYVSPFEAAAEPDRVDRSPRVARMLAGVERPIRAPLEAAEVTRPVAKWVAGGRTREGRARRAEIALYARRRLGGDGWPKVWKLVFFSDADTAVNVTRRGRGLRRQTVTETCDGVTLPASPAPPKRRTKKSDLASALADLVAAQERLIACLREHELV